MKRISILLLAGLIGLPVFSHAQDAATEERLNQLSAKIDALVEAKDVQNKRIEELASQIRELQKQANKPTDNYASAEDVKQLAEKLKEVDKKRQDDNERVLATLEKLGTTLRKSNSGTSSSTSTSTATVTPSNNGPEKGFEYVVQSGDTYALIAKKYRDNNIKVTSKQIMEANPNVKAENLKVGQKIFIPAPQ